MPHPSRSALLCASTCFSFFFSCSSLPEAAQSAHASRLAGSAAGDEDDDELGLLQLSEFSQHAHSTADGSGRMKRQMSQAKAGRSATSSRLPRPSGWFGSFSEGESTFSEDGVLSSPDDPEFYAQHGADPSVPYPFFQQWSRGSEFFHESQSGLIDAWQTHFPAVQGSMAGNRNIHNGKWVYTPDGWVQLYVTQKDDPRTYTGSMPAQPSDQNQPQFFDNSVQQYDGYGRYKLPERDSGSYYSEMGWAERSVNTTLKCKDPGCIANVSISAFDGGREEGKNCRVSVHVYATDYDDEFSQEVVSYLKINGAVAKKTCHPSARGCNLTAETPMFPCLNSFAVDNLVDRWGTLVVEGKISHWVDECPVDGNLLSGVVWVTCMVRPLPPNLFAGATTTTTTTTNPALQPILATSTMRCDFPGCEAQTLLQFSPALALMGGKCTVSINVTQTDYDDHLGLPEDIEYIQISGVNATKGPVSPGKNPCTAEFRNQSLTEDEKIFSVLKDYDVTEAVTKAEPLGTLFISGKISAQVDECGFEGHLLYGTILLNCQPPKS